MTAGDTKRVVGSAAPRKEDRRYVTGQGMYVEDVRLPGMLHVAFVRSPHACAVIRSIDSEAARAVPGVVDVITRDDWPELASALPVINGSASDSSPYVKRMSVAPHTLLPTRVAYVGEQVAIVVAESAYAAADGAEAVDVDYEPLPAVAHLDDAMKPEAVRVHEGYDNVVGHLSHRIGDPEAAFRDAEIVIEKRLETQSLKAMAIECRGCAAQWEPATGTLNVWSTCQFPYMLRSTLAGILGWENESVRVFARDVGGGFGLKGVMYPEDMILPLVAWRLQRSVRWVETRSEHMISSNHSGDQFHDVRLAARRDGTITAMDVKLYKDVGAYDHFDMMLQINTINHLTTHYKVPNLGVEGWAVSTNTPPGSPFRGAGRVEAVFTMDRMLDFLARETGLDPLELRRRNIVTSADLPYANGMIYRDNVPVAYDDVDFPQLLDRAAANADYAGWRARQPRMRAEGRAVGIGVSSYVEAGGLGPCEGATIRIDEKGRVSVHVGVNSQGQSHETTLAQICADAIGATYDSVTVRGGDTALLHTGFGTGASRVALNTGNAVAAAGSTLRGRIAALAAEILGCTAEEVVLADGMASMAGARQNAIDFGELAARAARDRRMAELGGPGLVATEFYYPRTVVWSSGVNIAVVEVDRGSGDVKILDYVFVHDCGVPLNPDVVEGQIMGGLTQGLGIALGERAVYDDQGQVLSGSLMDYFVPRAEDVPAVALDHLVIPSRDNPLGIKSVGESGPNSPPAALAAAIEDAFGGRLEITSLPVDRGMILKALAKEEAR